MVEGANMQVAAMIRSFRSINPDGKAENDYQELFKQASNNLERRVRSHRPRKLFDCDNLYDPPNRLEHTILPALKGKLRSLSLALNESDLQSSQSKSWYDRVFDHLIEIEDLLEQTDISVISTWRGLEPIQKFPIIVNPPFRVEKLLSLVEDLFEHELRQLFQECQNFFDHLDSLSSPSTRDPPTAAQGNLVEQKTVVSVRAIDYIVQSFRKPSLVLAKERWHDLATGFDYFFEFPPERASLYLVQPHWPLPMKEVYIHRNLITMMTFPAAIPIIKLCRTYFNKLVRSASSHSLIFTSPSMNMEEERLMELIEQTMNFKQHTYTFLGSFQCYSPSLEKALDETNCFESAFDGLTSPILEDYWDSLLAIQDPRVDQQAIADARRWLKSWKSLFSLAVQNFAEVIRELI
ncbi:hypothetical protein PTTG_27194 [Puccinia triticina 1-1 BBBD Race 1]|uniref:Uncharacterized protein n=2 Tax=Puccinia triticina TaxID=208348 RepID=A0A180GM44_PUCT1|nr:uncharacterized protein PtA15_16A242 [Puccinia triticina]OAV93877.1 hypothetical protein PTTG_27194 [Puccinia triticina 1-1 BBBD Race 1]WAQ92336.1 hypothetical protein PtA15_16A242 [Puccinia triticina]WAR64066.1 hypothetical protein PtB15_16B225 [Puccinia triticina]